MYTYLSLVFIPNLEIILLRAILLKTISFSFSHKVFQKWAHFCADLYNTNEYAICPRKRILSRIKFLFFKKNSIHTNQSKHCLPLTHYVRAKRTTEPAARTFFCLVIVNKWLWKQTISLYIWIYLYLSVDNIVTLAVVLGMSLPMVIGFYDPQFFEIINSFQHLMCMK